MAHHQHSKFQLDVESVPNQYSRAKYLSHSNKVIYLLFFYWWIMLYNWIFSSSKKGHRNHKVLGWDVQSAIKLTQD